ncbi:hypothetical protein ACHAXR_013514 [Thalassiosira sp. AJA248-18]
MSWATIFVSLLVTVDAFTQNNGLSSIQQRSTALSMADTTSPSDVKKTTLTDDTKWRLRMLLNDVRTTKGKKLDGQLFVVEGNFIEEDGYEPPQGFFTPTGQQSADDGEEKSDGGGVMSLEVSNSRWKLSEDPDDPKDGLWIWGLFKEPLYPFMLLQMETKELTLSSSADGENDDSIPALKLYARINHYRKDDVGVELQAATLNVRILEQVQLPGATVDLYEEEAVGQISFQPL